MLKSIRTATFAAFLLGMTGALAQGPSAAPEAAAKAKLNPDAVVLATVPEKAAPGAPDLAKDPTLFVVGYAHLDTEWRWDYPQVINEYLKRTLEDNFALIDKYPHYLFNFTGANRYMMFKEYYPADYERLKAYIAAGRWYPGGASMEENDVNAPNAESIIRQVLYGNEFFRQEFGKAAADYMLPDCFGFPASLPSVLSHAGLLGFSTQKLSAGWQPAAHVGGPGSPQHTPPGIPFNVGIWTGPDGKSIIGAVNPGSYSADDTTDLSKDPQWTDAVAIDREVGGVDADYHYVGTGDIGGAPREDGVALMEATITKGMGIIPARGGRGGGGGRGGRGGRGPNGELLPPPPPPTPVRVGDGPVNVKWATTDEMFLDMKDMDLSKLPKYEGDLELINHSAGSLTSEAAHKRWNRENEILASEAEAASVGAWWLGGRSYPAPRLDYAWRLLLGGQFHDIMAGTADATAYTYSWNDDTLAANQFSVALTSGTGAIAGEMDTATAGTPLVVFNPLNIARQDVVEADIALGGSPAGVRVTGPDGAAAPAQIEGAGADGKSHIVFVARVPAMGYAVYSARTAAAPAAASELKATDSTLENARYKVSLNADGDVASIYDKQLKRELLSAPMRLSFQTESPSVWPAWNMDWQDQSAAPRAYVAGPAKIAIAENGPARVALSIERDAEGSHFIQTVRLSAGDAGNRVEFGASVDWKTARSALMADFPLAAANNVATYNWDVGTIQRTNDDDRKFEVASHQWVDLTDRGGAYGATLLTDVKNASDKPDDNTLRLTLLYTPGLSRGQALPGGSYTDQATQDWGHHEMWFGLAGHAGDWRQEQTDWQGFRLNEPLVAFTTPKHSGPLGSDVSLLHLDNSRIRVLALKKAEASNEVVVRMVEMNGQAEPDVHVGFAGRVLAAREINGQEQPLGTARVENGELVASFSAYQPRSFAVKLAAPAAPEEKIQSKAVSLTFDRAVASADGAAAAQGFDAAGDSLPAEMLPATVAYGGIQFDLGPANGANAVTARGQTIALPTGAFHRVYVLAAADGDQAGTFKVGDQATDLEIQNWTGYIGQWDYRDWKGVRFSVPATGRGGAPAAANAPPRMVNRSVYAGLNPGYIKRAPVAWFASHHHDAAGKNVAYSYSYLFAYALDAPAGAKTLTLPDNDKIRILAVTVANDAGAVAPARPLYDTLPYAGMTEARKAALYTQGPGADAVPGELPAAAGGGRP